MIVEDKVIEKMEESINKILKEGLNTNNLDTLYKLSKVKHLAKEDKEMMDSYGGRHAGYDTYGDYDHDRYGRRGYDTKYRGHDHLEKMYDYYGRYMDGRMRYGTNEDTKKSLEYMLRSMEDFARMLREDATSQEEIMMIKQTAQRIANM